MYGSASAHACASSNELNSAITVEPVKPASPGLSNQLLALDLLSKVGLHREVFVGVLDVVGEHLGAFLMNFRRLEKNHVPHIEISLFYFTELGRLNSLSC